MSYPLYMLGRWDEALAALAEPTEEQVTSGAMLLSLLTSTLEIHVHRGDLDRARSLYAAFAAAEESADVQAKSGHAAATAVIRRAEGRLQETLDAAELALGAGEAMANDHQFIKQALVEGVEAALALGDRARADKLLAVLDAVPRGLRAPY